MTNNDILNHIRSTFSINDNTVIEIFVLADFTVTQEQLTAWFNSENGENLLITDTELAIFLNGFINLKRGKRDGEQAKPEAHINNNMVFQKLRIALNLKAEDILQTLQCVDFHLSKHELSAFFRKPENKHYKECRDETLQLFLLGTKTQLSLKNSASV